MRRVSAEEKDVARRAERESRDLAYISDPNEWVSLTMCCPMKRHKAGGGMPEVAYLIGDGPNLYHGMVFRRSENDRKEEFKDFAAIIDAGWQVD